MGITGLNVGIVNLKKGRQVQQKEAKVDRKIERAGFGMASEIDDDSLIMASGRQPKTTSYSKDASSTHAGAFLMRSHGGKCGDLKERSTQFHGPTVPSMPPISPLAISGGGLLVHSSRQFDKTVGNLGANSQGGEAFFSARIQAPLI